MAQETEECMRIIIMLGNAVVPAARDVIRLIARASIGALKAGGSKAASAVTDRVDGLGRNGIVRNAARLGGTVQTLDVTDKLGRDDLHDIGRLCRKCGAGFAIVRMDTGASSRLAIQFRAQDASTIQAVLSAALEERVVDDRDLDEALSPCRPAEPVRYGGLDWSGNRDGGLQAAFTSADGRAMTASAGPDGSWSISGPTGEVEMVGAQTLQGSAGEGPGRGQDWSLAMASAHANAIGDEAVAQASKRWASSREYISGMRSADVIAAANGAVKKRKAANAPKPGLRPSGSPAAPKHDGIKR